MHYICHNLFASRRGDRRVGDLNNMHAYMLLQLLRAPRWIGPIVTLWLVHPTDSYVVLPDDDHPTKIRYSARKTGSSNERLLTRQNNVSLSGTQIIWQNHVSQDTLFCLIIWINLGILLKLRYNFLKIEITLKAEILTDDKEWLNVSKKLKTWKTSKYEIHGFAWSRQCSLTTRAKVIFYLFSARVGL